MAYRRIGSALLIGVVVFGSAPLRAEESLADLELRELLQIEVFEVASRIPTPRFEVPGTVYRFGRNDFTRLGIRRLDDLLEYVPGIQLNQYRKRHRAVWMRGVIDRYNDKVLLLVDGVPVRQLYYGHFSTGDDFPLERIEHVEIIMGPASAVYGPNAFAGIIAITSREFNDVASYQATGELADNDKMRASVVANSRQFQAIATLTQQDAPFPAEYRTLLGEVPLNSLDEQYASLHLGWRPLPETEVRLDYQHAEYPFAFILNALDIGIVENPLNVRVRHASGALDDGRIEARGYYTLDRSREIEVVRATGSETTEYQDGVASGASLAWFRRFDMHTIGSGIEWNMDRADRMEIDGEPLLLDAHVRNSNYSLFVEDVVQFSKSFSLTAGGRFDRFDAFDNGFNHRIAAVWSPFSDHVFKLMQGTGIRAPTYREYLKILQGTDFVPPALKPERLRTIEASWQVQGAESAFMLAAYHNRYRQFIGEQTTPDYADEYHYNQPGEWVTRGLDAEYLRRYGEYNLRLTAAWLDIDESELEREYPMAKWTGSLLFDGPLHGAHRFAARLLFQSDRTDYNDASFTDDEPDAFLQLGIAINGPLTENVRYNFGIDNATDELIFDAPGDFEPTRYNHVRAARKVWLRLTAEF